MLLSFCASLFATTASERFLIHSDVTPTYIGVFKHVALGATCLGLQGLLIQVMERTKLRDVRELLVDRGVSSGSHDE